MSICGQNSNFTSKSNTYESPVFLFCRKIRCFWRLGGGLEAQIAVKYDVFGAWVETWGHKFS